MEELKFSFSYNKDCETVKDPSLVIMVLTPTLEADFQKDVFVWLEIEVMQGKRTVLDSGEIEYRLHLCDEKRDQLKAMLHSSVFNVNPNAAN